jgi:hypothetical protein
MGFLRFRKANNRAVLGFLLPCLAMGAASAIVLWGRSHDLPFSMWLPILTLVPALLAGGTVLAVTSIPRIPDLGDKDYAYAGLVLNVFLILLYLSGVIYSLFCGTSG